MQSRTRAVGCLALGDDAFGYGGSVAEARDTVNAAEIMIDVRPGPG